MKTYALFILIFVLMAGSAASYTRITSSSGDSPRWATMPVPFWINERGVPQIANDSEFEAVAASFHTWEAVPTADVHFDYRGTTSTRSGGKDGMNLVTFTDDTTPLGSSTIAVTFSYFKVQNNTLLFDEADIVFNTALDFSTSGETGKFDIQSVLTHEIGHLLGLDHSGMVSSVMVPFSQPSQVNQRTLAYDDIAGISEIYPKSSANPAVGQIRGFVLNGTFPVFGANVVAVDQNGTPWVSTLSQPTGQYTIRFLPPGTYRVFAEPLDLPVTEQNVGGGTTSWYRNLKTDFRTTYYGNVASMAEAKTIQVAAGNSSSLSADIQVLPKSATGLNLTRPAFAPRIPRDASGTLTIGGEDITAGTSFLTSSPDVFLGAPTYGGPISSVASTSAAMPLSVSGSAALGPKNMIVTRGGDSSIVSGAIVIVDHQPALEAISPVSGPSEGGSTVTITGSNFRPGARVYFGGLSAASTDVRSSNTILATTTRNVPGSANVQVINADGTNGLIARGFNFVPPAPAITGVTPSSGPPTTTVTIDGTQFDTHPENIEVRFNGATARVISSSATQIVAIVPYGATSGPVTVRVFGIPASGDVSFDVTPAAVSLNRALNGYFFIDSTTSLGGSNLVFQGPFAMDDGLSSIQLPFTFSLFNDIYLAGSAITVSTNGWISLESIGDPYVYQNGPLPGTSVVDSGGTARIIPPSLIAPFFDDLAILPGVSSVSTRIVGSAPNRRFVIQWTNVTILDEDGNDLHSSVTFEVILFEGSNDIQFVYKAPKGSRSDGSSATLGLQNLTRDKAVLTSFNRPKVVDGSFVTYRFNQGAYAVSEGDLTPPSRPVVMDGGALTSSQTELFASWTAEDKESAIREYQYAIGRTPGAADVRPFTSTTQNSALVTGLSLGVGAMYYFAVRAVNNAGLVSEVGVSDGIRVDPTFQPDIKIIPSGPQSSTEFSGIALFAPSAMSVVLKALDNNGNFITGEGVQNPVTVSLSAGQQYARLIRELFGLSSFDGWIEIEASAKGLGVYTATGSSDMSQMDGSVVREPSKDFMLFHPGSTAIMVNPSNRPATVTVTSTGNLTRTLTIAPRSRVLTSINGISRVQSTEGLAVIERFGSPGKLGIGMSAPVSSAQSLLVIPDGVTGLGYATTLSLANVGTIPVQTTVSFGSFSRTISLEANATMRISLADFLQIPTNEIRVGAVKVRTASILGFGSQPALVGVVDIENQSGLVSIGAQPAATDVSFAHVANGNGLFTGLCIAAGDSAATVTINVYPESGGTPKSATIALPANGHISKLLSELVSGVATQLGGYIRIHSDQPIWSWEIYGSDLIMASGPPM